MASLMLRTGGHPVDGGEYEDSARFDALEFPVIHPAWRRATTITADREKCT